MGAVALAAVAVAPGGVRSAGAEAATGRVPRELHFSGGGSDGGVGMS